MKEVAGVSIYNVKFVKTPIPSKFHFLTLIKIVRDFTINIYCFIGYEEDLMKNLVSMRYKQDDRAKRNILDITGFDSLSLSLSV